MAVGRLQLVVGGGGGTAAASGSYQQQQQRDGFGRHRRQPARPRVGARELHDAMLKTAELAS